MTQAGPKPAAPPAAPLGAALADRDVRAALVCHAVARFGVWLADRPPADRRERAEEAVQEAGARALERAAEFDPTRPAVAWLHAILNNVLHEHCRDLRKQPAQPAAVPGAWAGLEARLGDRADLPDLLAGLPAGQREIVTLHHLEGRSHDEIAAARGMS